MYSTPIGQGVHDVTEERKVEKEIWFELFFLKRTLNSVNGKRFDNLDGKVSF